MNSASEALITAELPDDHSECEPPDPISNSEVKVLSADGSVGFPHVRVGHRQALKYTSPNQSSGWGFVVYGHCEMICNALHVELQLKLPPPPKNCIEKLTHE